MLNYTDVTEPTGSQHPSL